MSWKTLRTKQPGRAACQAMSGNGGTCPKRVAPPSDRYCKTHAHLEARPPAPTDPTPPRPGADRKTDPWWQAVPAPLPAAEVARLRQAVGYEPTRTNEGDAA